MSREIKPPRFLIMVTVAIFLFMAAAALLIVQVRAEQSGVEEKQ